MAVGFVDDVLVHFIGYDVGVIFLRQVGDELQLVIGEHLAAGVGGVAQDQRLGILLEGRFQLVHIKMELRRVQGHVDRFRAGEDGIRPVVFIEGGEHDDLIAGVGHSHHGRHHGLGAAAGDHDLPVGVDGAPHELGLLSRQGFAEVLCAPGDGVLMEVLMGHLRQPVQNLLGRLEVGKALGQVDGVVLERDPSHPADDGIGKGLGTFR